MNLDYSLNLSKEVAVNWFHFCMLGLPEIMGSCETKKRHKDFHKENWGHAQFSSHKFTWGRVLNNSLHGLYEWNHQTKTNKEKGDICALFFCHQRFSIVQKKKPFTQVCHNFAIYFEINIVCVFRAELTIKPPFLTKKLSVSSTHKNSLGFSFQAHAVACNEVK